MRDNPMLKLLREDPMFLIESVKRIAAYEGEIDHTQTSAMKVLRDMADSLRRYTTLTSKQQSYARDLIERNFLYLLADLAQQSEEKRQEVVATVDSYRSNPMWGIF